MKRSAGIAAAGVAFCTLTGWTLQQSRTSAGAQSAPADVVLLNGTVITVDPKDTIAEALAIRGGRIVYVGTTAAARQMAGDSTRVIDLAGRTATPGLIDTHVHFSEPADTLDLGDARSMDDVIAQVLLSDDPAEEAAPRGVVLPAEVLLPEISPDAPL